MENQRKLIDFFFLAARETRTHYHQNIEIIYVLEGSMKIVIDDEIYRLSKGDFILINANKNHTFDTSKNILGIRYEIDFHLLAKQLGTMELFFWCNTVADRNDAYAEVRKTLDEIAKCYDQKEGEGYLYLNSLYYKLLYQLASNFMIKAYDTRLNLDNSQERIRISQIQNYIQANYQMQISLKDLADQLFLSNAYLSKYIKRNLGLTFVDYLNNVRLFHAIDELLYTNKKLTHIALDNGFPSSAAFSKAFKAMYHESPVSYRAKKHQEKQTNADICPKSVEGKIAAYLRERGSAQNHEVSGKNILELDAQKIIGQKQAWKKIMNIGKAEIVLRSDVQQHVLQVHERIPFEYGRIWNTGDLMPFKETMTTGVLNFNRLDRVLDFLVKNHITPYIEMGFKPTQIFNTPKKLLEVMPAVPNYTIECFKEGMRQLAIHLINRYGIEQLETWCFEVWNDPSLRMGEESARYYEVFEAIYKNMKKISTKIRVGGAGFILGIENRFCERVFRSWKEREIGPDFLSFYSYQYISVVKGNVEYRRKSIDSNYMVNQLENMKDVMKEAGFLIPEIHISEWNNTVSNRNILNDSCEQGAYILKNCIEMSDKVGAMGYWHLTDLYSESYDTCTILYGDSGLVSKDGIYKPAFYAFEFMNKLLPMQLGKSENLLVTTNGRKEYAIVCHNFQKLSHRYAEKEENEILMDEMDQYLIHGGKCQYVVKIRNVENGTYIIKTSAVNQKHGGVHENWKRLGYMRELSEKEIDYMKESSIPLKTMITIEATNHTLELEINLEEQEIQLLEIQYQYQGMQPERVKYEV